jgi:hypothetical protein
MIPPDRVDHYHRITDDELLALCRYLDRPDNDRAADVHFLGVRERLYRAAEEVLNEERAGRRS